MERNTALVTLAVCALTLTVISRASATDCNSNGIPDTADIAAGTSLDCNRDAQPDECALTAPRQVTRLVGPDTQPEDFFGLRMDAATDILVVGAPEHAEFGYRSGAAYVFEFAGNAWQESAKLTAEDASPDDRFGWSVSIDGDAIAVGAPVEGNSKTGAVYIFQRTGGQWLQTGKVTALDGSAMDEFGHSVDLSGDRLLVGAFSDNVTGLYSGSAYLFARSGGTWQQVAKLTSSDLAASDRFGAALSLEGKTAIIGSFGDDDFGNNTGSAYVFEEAGGAWQETAKLLANDAGTNGYFGGSVSLSGDHVAIGAANGAAYIFHRDEGVWTQTDRLTAANAPMGEKLGAAVRLRSGSLIVNASSSVPDAPRFNAAYVFRDSGAWTQFARVTTSGATANEIIGSDVVLNARHAFISSLIVDEEDALIGGGAVYAFELTADCNENGVIDTCDLAGGTSSDCNGNGWPDECDIASAVASDCNANHIPDDCDLAGGTSRDCNANAAPDECDIAGGASPDCDGNGGPDECDIAAGTAADCTGNAVPDRCDIQSGATPDCDASGVPDICELSAGTSADCNINGVPDACDIASGTDQDCNANIIPDGCEADCNTNAHPDDCDIAAGTDADCDANGLPDACDLAAGLVRDCNGNALLDDCELAAGSATDCNGNSAVDVCELGNPLERALFELTNGASYQFGSGIATVDDTAFVTAPNESLPAGRTGAVYLFRANEPAGSWHPAGKWVSPVDFPFGDFGAAIATDGNRVAITQRQSFGGRVFIYERASGDDDAWQLIGDLTPLSPDDDGFGASVAISGDTVIVGAPEYIGLNQRGAAYVFRRVSGTWQQITLLRAWDTSSFERFGRSVALDGDVAAVASLWQHPQQPSNLRASVYLFRNPGSSPWTNVAKLTAADIGATRLYQDQIALRDGTLAVAGTVPSESIWGSKSSIYLLREQSPSQWRPAAVLTPQALSEVWSVLSFAFDGDTVVMGGQVPFGPAPGPRRTFLFRATDPERLHWHQFGVLADGDTANGNLQSLKSAVGTRYALFSDFNSAARVHVFDLHSTTHDCNGNLAPDVCDLAADPAIDCNGDGLLDACQPVGDVNADGLVDLIDHAAFAGCLGGVGGILTAPCCLADLDGDGDADLADFAGLQRSLGEW